MMSLTVAPRRLSLEDFRRLPEGPPYYEREPDGEVIEMSSATDQHNALVALLFAELHRFVRSHALGRVSTNVDVFFPSGRVYMPDLCFVPQGRAQAPAPDGKIHALPAMVAEFVSAAGRSRDQVAKFRAYRDEGVEWYWLIDSEALGTEEYHLEEGRYVRTACHAEGEVFSPGVFPGFSINLKELIEA